MTDIGNIKPHHSQEIQSNGFFNNLKIVLRSRNFLVILLTNYTGSVFLAAWIYLNLFFRDVGISYFELGLANSWSLMIGLFSTMIGGYWADKHIPHRKYMASFNKFFNGLAALLIPFVSDFYGLLVVWTVFGFGQFCQSSIDPILFESLPQTQMGTGTSLFTICGIFGIIGLILVGFLIQDNFVSGMKIFWLLASISSFIDFIIRLLFLKKTEYINSIKQTNNNHIVLDIFEQYKVGFKVLVATIPLFILIFLLDVISDLNYQFAQNFFLNENVNMEYTAINYSMIGASMVGVIGGIVAGYFLDKSENETIIMLSVYFLLPFAVILLLYSPMNPKWTNIFPNGEIWSVISSTAFIAVVIKTGNDQVWRTVAWGAVGRKIPREHSGKVISIFTMIVSSIGVIISPIVGYIYQIKGGYPLLIFVLILNILILTILIIKWWKEISLRSRNQKITVNT